MNILITGANRGIGYAITKKLLSRGHRVIGLSRTIHNLLEIQSVDLIVYEVDLLDINQINKVGKHYALKCDSSFLFDS